MAEKATKKDIQITKKKLILIDLDGTTLDKDFRTFNALNHKVLTHLHKLGHKVCIATGRNYLSALRYYEELGLDTLMATYNGAYINNPSKEKSGKESEIFKTNSISNEVIRDIMKEKIIKDNLIDALVDSNEREIICTEDKDIYWHEVWFNKNKFIHTNDILKNLGKRNALQLILEFENKENKLNEIIATLRRKYHDFIYFDIVNKLKKDPKNPKSPTLVPDPERIVIRIRSKEADKYKAVKEITGKKGYQIPMEDVIAFGDSENDIDMIRNVGWGVVVANAETYLKTLTKDITEKKNYEGGVGDYLIKYFNLSLNVGIEKKKK